MGYDVVLVRRKYARDITERWFGVASVESSVVGEHSAQKGVRVSNTVQVGDVEHLPESMPAPQIPSTSYSAKSPANDKRKRSKTPAPVLIKLRFEFDDESVALPEGRRVYFDVVYFDVPNLAIALKNQSKIASSGQRSHSRRAAPLFQSNPPYITYQFIILQLYFSI